MLLQSSNKKDLRQHLLQQRKQLNPHIYTNYSQYINVQCTALEVFQKSTHIGSYYPILQEVDTRYIQNYIRQTEKKYYLPILQKNKELSFGLYTVYTTCTLNSYAIPEPCSPIIKSAWDLDVIILPIVGFNMSLYRLGMGKGYYDYTLKQDIQKQRPYLIGFAFELQKVSSHFQDPWDIKLDTIITEERVY